MGNSGTRHILTLGNIFENWYEAKTLTFIIFKWTSLSVKQFEELDPTAPSSEGPFPPPRPIMNSSKIWRIVKLGLPKIRLCNLYLPVILSVLALQTNLIFPVSCISESCMKINIYLNFLFSQLFVVSQKVLWRPLKLL